MADSAASLFDQWERWLGQEQMIISAAELHGMLTGLLASGQRASGNEWLPILADLANDGEEFSPAMKGRLEQLGKTIRADLGCPEISFQTLLPSDDELLADRLVALTEWAQCFLVGFAVNQQNLQKASADLREGIQDLAEIARLAPDAVADEESERSFYEIAEYVRITAIMCFGELGQMPPPKPTANSTIH